MTSMYGSDLTPYDHSFTYHINDLPSKNNNLTFTEGSIIDRISKEPKFSKFFYMIKLGALAGMLDSYTNTYTLFVPDDNAFPFSDDVLINMDKYTAKETVLYHMLPAKVPLSLLLSSNGMYLETKINNSINSKIFSKRLLLQEGPFITKSRVILNNASYIIYPDIPNNNGIIHVINKILIPPVFATSLGQYLFKEEPSNEEIAVEIMPLEETLN